MQIPDEFGVKYGGQLYRPLGCVPHENKSGAIIELMEWETNCPDCGVQFRIRTKLVFDAPRRRCDDCKAPGIKVERDADQREMRRLGAARKVIA